MDTERMGPPHKVEEWPTVAAFVKATKPQMPPSKEPIRIDIKDAIALGMTHLVSLFDKDRDQEPFFYANHRADGTGEMHHAVNIGIPHVTGRCLLGYLLGKETTGIAVSDTAVAVLERYLRQSFDNEDHLNSYSDPARENKRFVEFHNLREGLYGLVLLIRDRHSVWARETAEQMLRMLDTLTDEAGTWSLERARKRGMAERCEGVSVANAARLVDPLLEYYQMTGEPLALKLAGLYARRGIEVMFEADGRFHPDMARSSGHIHSLTSALSGITRYALHVQDAKLVEACRRIMTRGVPEYFSSWGWGDEVYVIHPANVVGRGEVNQTGDVVRTALALGEAGDPHYFEMAERYLRSLLLPSQQREADLKGFLKENAHPRSDAERDVLRRSIGGFGFPLPNDRMREGDWPITTLDITSGAVHALSECWRNRMTCDAGECKLNLLFDVENEHFRVRSHLPTEGRIEFTARSERRLKIRIPEWVDRKSVVLEVQGKRRELHYENGYLVVDKLASGQSGAVRFAVPCKVERERVDGTEYVTTWAGNQILKIEPRGKVSPLPY